MTAPFKLPVRIERGLLLDAHACEMIVDLYDATPEERDHIVKAINDRPKHLAALQFALDACLEFKEEERDRELQATLEEALK